VNEIRFSGSRKREYVEWAKKVVAGLRGENAPLERLFEQTAREKTALFAGD
jgi:hypothetical protein